MKLLATTFLALAVSVAAAVPAFESSDRSGAVHFVEEPPPERDDCPLCGGDPALHVRRLFTLANVAAWTTAYALPR
ncbi:MAG: hypothetical protein ACKVWV_13125 [Planctomycetota bacterium]